MSRGERLLYVAALLGLFPGRASAAGTEVDLRGELVAVFGDDDLLHAEDATLPPSPAASFGERPGFALAVDELSLRPLGSERALIVELGVSDVSSSGMLGAAVARVGLRSLPTPSAAGLGSEDAGSYLLLSQRMGARQLELRLLPLAGDRVRAGFLESLCWGGEAGSFRDTPYRAALGPVSAATVSYGDSNATVSAAVKTALLAERDAQGGLHDRTQYAVFVGGRWRVHPDLELAVHAGYLTQGTLDQPDVRGEPSLTIGTNARAVLGRAVHVAEVPSLLPLVEHEPAPGRAVELALSVEGSFLWQRVRDSDRTSLARLRPASGAALVLGLQWARLHAVAGASLRDVEFVTRQGPGWSLPETNPGGVAASNELLLFSAARFKLLPRLELGFDFDLRRPAALTARSANGYRALLVDGPGRVTLLPSGASPSPVLEARPTITWRASERIACVLWSTYRSNSNVVGYESTSGDAGDAGDGLELERRGLSPHFIGWGVGSRALF